MSDEHFDKMQRRPAYPGNFSGYSGMTLYDAYFIAALSGVAADESLEIQNAPDRAHKLALECLKIRHNYLNPPT